MLSTIVLSFLVAACHGGFLPFYGEPITSAASPFIHGFANPVFHQPLLFNNFYTHQPFFNSFFAPPAQPIFFHQPQPHFLPFPNFLTLPSAPAQQQEEPKSSGGYGAPASGYGAPSGPAPASGGYGGPDAGPSGGYGAPSSASGPSGSSSNAGGYGSGPSDEAQAAGTGSDKIEVFQDDFEEMNRENETEEEKRADQYQGLIVNKRENDGNSGSGEQVALNDRKGGEPEQGYLPPPQRNNDGGR